MALQEIHLYRSPNKYLQNGFLPLNQADFEYSPLRSDFLPDLDDKSAFENGWKHLILPTYREVTSLSLAALLYITCS